MSKPLHWKETKMAFVDVGIGTAMMYGALAGAGAGAIYTVSKARMCLMEPL